MTFFTKYALLFKVAFFMLLTYEGYIYYDRTSYLSTIDWGLIVLSFVNIFLVEWNSLNSILLMKTAWRLYCHGYAQLYLFETPKMEETQSNFYWIGFMLESLANDIYSFILNIQNFFYGFEIMIINAFSIVCILIALLMTFLHQWIEDININAPTHKNIS